MCLFAHLPSCAAVQHKVQQHPDPPPLKWSALEYGFRPEEDRDGEEETQAGRDCRQVTTSGCVALAGQDGRGSDPFDWGDGGDVLSLAPRVRWAEVGSGKAAEGP